MKLTAKQTKIVIALAALSLIAAGAYYAVVLIRRKKAWVSWFIAEMQKSTTANKNGLILNPTAEQLENLKQLAENVLYKANKVAKGWDFHSGFRSPEVNNLVNGVFNSQHLKGEAVDVVFSNTVEVFNYIKENLDFDQLIWEGGTKQAPKWLHISYRKDNNRKQVIYNI